MFGPVTIAIRPPLPATPDSAQSLATKASPLAPQRRLDDGMAPGLDGEGERIVDLGPRPVAVSGKLGESGGDVDRREPFGRAP